MSKTTTPESPGLLDSKGLGQRLSISPKTVNQLARAGRIPFIEVLPGSRRYCLPEVIEALRRQGGKESLV